MAEAVSADGVPTKYVSGACKKQRISFGFGLSIPLLRHEAPAFHARLDAFSSVRALVKSSAAINIDRLASDGGGLLGAEKSAARATSSAVCPRGLNEQAAVNGLARHSHAPLVGIRSFSHPEICSGDQSRISLLAAVFRNFGLTARRHFFDRNAKSQAC